MRRAWTGVIVAVVIGVGGLGLCRGGEPEEEFFEEREELVEAEEGPGMDEAPSVGVSPGLDAAPAEVSPAVEEASPTRVTFEEEEEEWEPEVREEPRVRAVPEHLEGVREELRAEESVWEPYLEEEFEEFEEWEEFEEFEEFEEYREGAVEFVESGEGRESDEWDEEQWEEEEWGEEEWEELTERVAAGSQAQESFEEFQRDLDQVLDGRVTAEWSPEQWDEAQVSAGVGAIETLYWLTRELAMNRGMAPQRRQVVEESLQSAPEETVEEDGPEVEGLDEEEEERLSFWMETARWVREIQEESFPELWALADAVEEAAAQIDPERPEGEQREEIAAFFEVLEEALAAMVPGEEAGVGS